MKIAFVLVLALCLPILSHADDRDALHGTLADAVKNSIAVTYVPASTLLPVGVSKMGGMPDVPSGFVWPTYTGENYDGIIATRPLAFLAQYNLAEVSAYDLDHALPANGMLYFFYELETMTWGMYTEDAGSAYVLYHAGDISTLSPAAPPSNLPDDFRLPECSVSFETKQSLPDFEEYAEYHDSVDFDAYARARTALGCAPDSGTESVSKLLGYADIIQNNMLMECEMGARRMNYTQYAALSDAERRILFAKSQEWTLLFQMGTLTVGDYTLMFGDGGYIYFYIKTSALQRNKFDNTWLILQCY